MTLDNETPSNPRDSLKLKLPEPEVSAEQPWGDDVLDRMQIADRLTNLIWNESNPFVISIHGYWDTGKTFMLKRWQKDLEKQGFKAIYFNAWQDDFCDDPLLAIIGQLTQYFKEGTLKNIAETIRETALPLIWRNALGVLNKTTGFTLESGTSGQRNLVDEYLKQRETKDELKESLGQMSSKVAEETQYPLVFIIDELDRCRPTFAIELLERVKHIFDIPNIVFVFGINRDELCSSLQSIYGEIDADIYLRRFFDMEFSLPEVDAEKFGKHLMQRHNLGEFFRDLSEHASHWVHFEEYGVLISHFPALWKGIGLSLRDIDYCVRSIGLVGRNIEPRRNMYPWLLGLLIPLKLKNFALYKQFISGQIFAGQVLDYLATTLWTNGLERRVAIALDEIETELYLAEATNSYTAQRESSVLEQLQLIQQGLEPNHPEYLSKRTVNSSPQRIGDLIRMIQSDMSRPNTRISLSYLASLIDLH